MYVPALMMQSKNVDCFKNTWQETGCNEESHPADPNKLV